MTTTYSLIFTILNRGFSDLVMDAARQSGATGGTIITARGTGSKVAENLFGITISQEKEIVLILATTSNKNAIMAAVTQAAGLNTQGKGITFSLPVDDVMGIAFGINEEQDAQLHLGEGVEPPDKENATIEANGASENMQ